MSFYNEWGFMFSPFSTNALEKNLNGETLLLGRDNEKATLKSRIVGSDLICCVEGENGIGKTSLLNVALYELLDKSEKVNPGFESEHLLELDSYLQLSTNDTVETFKKRTLVSIAKRIIRYHDNCPSADTSDFDIIKSYFKPTVNNGVGINGGIQNVNVGISASFDLNTTNLFQEFEIFSIIESLLHKLSIDKNFKGIICVIDNLELVRNDENVRVLVEELRDEVLKLPGTIWILVGTEYIFRSIVNSPRLTGYLNDPICVKPINERDYSKILRTRIKLSVIDEKSYYLPFNESEFESLMRILNGNFRMAFERINAFCTWAYDNEAILPEDELEKEELFNKWLSITTNEIIRDIFCELELEYLEYLFEYCTGTKAKKRKIISSLKKEQDLFDDWVFEMRNNHLLSFDGSSFVLDVKALFLKYYFDTFVNFDEMIKELESELKIEFN